MTRPNGEKLKIDDIRKMDSDADRKLAERNAEQAREAIEQGMPVVAVNRIFGTDIPAQ